MADSIRSWICAYLIDIGETYGGNLSDALFWEKKKKVQIVEVRSHVNLTHYNMRVFYYLVSYLSELGG